MSAIAQNNAQNNNAYITNRYDNDVAVIDTTTNTVVAAIPSVGNQPFGVAVSSDGSRVYITNVMSNDVAVIDAASNAIITSIPVGRGLGVAVTPKGDKVYVANVLDANVSVIDTASAAVITTIPVGLGPVGVAVTPDSKRVYVSNSFGDNTTVSKIDATTDTVVATIETGGTPTGGDRQPYGVAVAPDGRKVYVATQDGQNLLVIDVATDSVSKINLGTASRGVAVSPDGSRVYVSEDHIGPTTWNLAVIDAAAGTVITDIPLGDCNCVTYSGGPIGVAVTADGKRVYVALAAAADTANNTISFVSVIDTATNTKIASLGANEGIGAGPTSFGIFIQPPQPPAFAGTPGSPNCNGQSVSALTQKFGTFAAAATALGVTVKGLQQEIATFCT